MPRRSTGCERCRKRKVRCDEEKPACQRCRKVGIECPGYRPDLRVGARFVVHTVSQQAALSARWEVLGLPQAKFPGCSPTYIGPSQDIAPVTPGRFGSCSDKYRTSMWKRDDLSHGASGPKVSSEDGRGLCQTDFGEQRWLADDDRPEDRDDRPLVVITCPDRMSQRHVMRLGRMGAFLEVRYPTPGDKTAAKASYVAALPGLDLSMPLLQATIDTICLAGLGSAHHKEDLIHESRDSYGKALTLLSREVSRPPNRAERQISVITSIMLLCLAEQFDVITLPGTGAAGWVSHLTAVQQYLKACGPSVIKSPFDYLLFHNLRLSALFLGLAQRKAVPLDDPEWLELTQARRPDGSLALHDFSSLAMRVPALLETTDRLLDTRARTAHWTSELKMLSSSIVSLKHEFEYWYGLVQLQGDTHDIVNLHDLDKFDCSNATFHSSFHFRSPRALRQDTMQWIFVQMLYCTALRLMHFLPKDVITWPWDPDKVKREAYVLSTNLCRSVPYCATSGVAELKELSKWYLDSAQNYFEDADGCDDELSWCHDARCTITLSPTDLPADNSPDATKLWNLSRSSPCMLTPARYKAPDLRFGALLQPPKTGAPGSVDLPLTTHNSATFAANIRPELAGSDVEATWMLRV